MISNLTKTDGNKQMAPHYRNKTIQSLIQICYQHLSYSLKLAVKKCIIEYYIKQPDMLIILSKYFQNLKVNN